MLELKDFLNEIVELYEKANNKQVVEVEKEKVINKGISKEDEVMIRLGKKEVLDKVYNSYSYYDKVEKENGKYIFTSLENWLSKHINHQYIPEELSYKEFISYFKDDLLEIYKKCKEEKIKDFKEKESQEVKEEKDE
jgi:hypothetical protein